MPAKCKRIIEGKTYNTETATRLGGWDDDEGPYDVQGGWLYQTRFGAFFLHSYLHGADDQDYDDIKPLTPDEARAWLEKYQSWEVELIERLFGEMPEAGSGESKFTLRMPDSLRERLAEKAKANNQSLNAWMIRCLESCSEPAANDQHGQRDIPPMGNLAGSHRTRSRSGGL